VVITVLRVFIILRQLRNTVKFFHMLARSLLIYHFIFRTINICRFHSTSHFWAKNAFNHKSTIKTASNTIITHPINIIRDILDTITLLVDRYTASTTKHNLIIIFVVSNTTNSTTCIFLGNLCSIIKPNLLQTQQLFFFL
jgi:hypothetical protein